MQKRISKKILLYLFILLLLGTPNNKEFSKIYLNKNCEFCNSLARSSTRHHEVPVSVPSLASEVITSGTYCLEFGLWNSTLKRVE